jgi:hypothetical protein
MQQKDVQPEPCSHTRKATLLPKFSIRRGGSSRPEDIPQDLVVNDGAPSVSMKRASEPLASVDKLDSVVHNLPSRFVKRLRKKGQTRSVKAVSIATEPAPPAVLPEIAIVEKTEINTTPMEPRCMSTGTTSPPRLSLHRKAWLTDLMLQKSFTRKISSYWQRPVRHLQQLTRMPWSTYKWSVIRL